MPPARSRIVDDARSETSLTNTKDRGISGATSLKSKKSTALANNTASNHKNGILMNGTTVTSQTAAGTSSGEPSRESPHVRFA